MDVMRIRINSEQHLWIPNGAVVEVSAAYGKQLLDRNVGKLERTIPIETAQAPEPETATRKRGRPRKLETV